MKNLFALLLVAAIIFVSGCTSPPPAPVCGNNVCDQGESPSSCPADCQQPPPPPPVAACGNGVCDQGETSSSCPADCPDEWAAVRAADVPTFSSEWKPTPVRLEASDNGWEDSLFVTGDGQRVYFAYYPGDLIAGARTGSFADDIDIYYSDFPFTTKTKATDYYLSEDVWSEVGPFIAANGDVFYNSNRDYLRDQKSDTDVYKNNERLAFNDLLGDERNFGNPHYCSARDELWLDEDDTRMYILKNAAANGFGGAPELAPSPIQVESASNFQPFLTDDCNTIYFSSNRGDIPGITGPAIYKSTRNPDNTWTSPAPVAWSKVGLGEATLTADGTKFFYIQLFKNEAGEFTTDMFYAERAE